MWRLLTPQPVGGIPEPSREKSGRRYDIITSLFSPTLPNITTLTTVVILVTPRSTNSLQHPSLLKLSIRRYRQCMSWL